MRLFHSPNVTRCAACGESIEVQDLIGAIEDNEHAVFRPACLACASIAEETEEPSTSAVLAGAVWRKTKHTSQRSA